MENLNYLAIKVMQREFSFGHFEGEIGKEEIRKRNLELANELLEKAPPAVDVYKCPNCKRQSHRYITIYSSEARLSRPDSPEIEWDEVLICDCGTIYKIVNGA